MNRVPGYFLCRGSYSSPADKRSASVAPRRLVGYLISTSLGDTIPPVVCVSFEPVSGSFMRICYAPCVSEVCE